MFSGRKLSRGASALGVVVSLIAACIVLVPAAAEAKVTATSTALPGSFGAMVVDPATGHVFVSSYDANDVVVLDLSGHILKTITGEAGARGLVLVGADLYVVASTAGAIDDINTGSLTRTRTLTSGLAGIHDIVAAAGALWVVPSSPSTSLVSVAIADGTQTTYSNPLGFYGTGLVQDPADANTILEYEPGISAVTIAKIDVSTAPPTTLVNQNETTPGIDNVNNIAVSPDGLHVVPAGGAPYQFDDLGMSDLNPTGVVYPANPYPTAVAMSAANGGVFAGGMNGIYNPDVVEYRLGDPSTKLASFDFLTTSATVAPGGLAFSPDGKKLFAVTADKRFHVLTGTGTGSGSGTPVASAGKLTISKSSLAYGKQRVATHGRAKTITITNSTGADITLGNLLLQGKDQYSFYGSTNCFPHGRPRVFAAGASCHATLFFAPLKYGARHAVLRVLSSLPGSPQSVKLSGSGTEGYFLAGARGEVGNFGDAIYHGDATHLSLTSPIISLATTPNGAGYWLLGRDGGIFTYGNARFHGSTGARHLNKPIVAMYPTPSGKGYWLVASDGGIFTFGSARFHGSTGAMHLAAPIVAMASTRDGKGYWLVGAFGAVYAFGTAHKYGAASGLSAPVVQIAPTPTGHGYWLVTGDGHLYAYGDAANHGSAVGKAIVGIAPTSDGRGYWEVSRSGVIYSFGNAHAHGRLGAGANDVIGIAATAPPLPAVLVKFATRASGTSGAGSASAAIAHVGGIPR